MKVPALKIAPALVSVPDILEQTRLFQWCLDTFDGEVL